MSHLVWSFEVIRILATLPSSVRADILSKSGLLREFPQMHPVRRRGRFRGQRFFVSLEWLVYYLVERDVVAITAIGHGRRRGV